MHRQQLSRASVGLFVWSSGDKRANVFQFSFNARQSMGQDCTTPLLSTYRKSPSLTPKAYPDGHAAKQDPIIQARKATEGTESQASNIDTSTVNSSCNARTAQGTTCQQTSDLAGYAPHHKSSTALWPKQNITREDVHACTALSVKSPKHIQLTNNSAKWFSYKLLMSTKLMWHLQLFWG